MRLPAFRMLSKEQDRILNLPLDGSYVVIGPPGSGKTVIALYRAQMLHKRGDKSLLLVFNRTLKTYISAATDELEISAETISYHRWIQRTYMDNYSLRPPMLSEFGHDWARILAKVNSAPPEPGTLPYLIVDEGQDLHPMFYQLAHHMSKNLTVLADGNQVLNDENSSLAEIRQYALISAAPERLTTNYRNTRQIAELAACFHSGVETGIAAMPTRSGPPIVLGRHYARQQAIRNIQYVWDQNNKADIGVFLPKNKLVKSYVHRLQQLVGSENVQYYYRDYTNGRNEIKDNLDFKKPAIRITNYWLAKGLEFDTVFLPELQEYAGDPTSGSTKMLFYVLLSRARERLYIYYQDSETALVELIKKHLGSQPGDDASSIGKVPNSGDVPGGSSSRKVEPSKSAR